MARKIYNWESLPLLLPPEDTALVLNCNIQVVRKMCRNGVIPAIKVGGMWRVPRDKLRLQVEGGE